MKKAFIWILGLGGVLIAVLLVALLVVSHRLKANIQSSINTQLQALQEYMPSFSYQPFSCSGVRQVACESASIGLNGVMLENVRLEVGRFTQSQGSVRITSENLVFTKDGVLTLLFGVLAQDVDFSNVLLPKSLECEIEGVLGKDEQAQALQDAINTNATCIAKGENLSYKFAQAMQAELGELLEQTPSGFSDALSLVIKAYKEDSEKFLTHAQMRFSSAMLALEPRELERAIIAKLASDKELDTNAYEQYRAHLASSLQSMKAFIMYIALLSDYSSKAQGLESLVDGMTRMILGENSGVVSMLKASPASKLLSLEEWLHSPALALQQSGVAFSVEEVPLDSTKSTKNLAKE